MLSIDTSLLTPVSFLGGSSGTHFSGSRVSLMSSIISNLWFFNIDFRKRNTLPSRLGLRRLLSFLWKTCTRIVSKLPKIETKFRNFFNNPVIEGWIKLLLNHLYILKSVMLFFTLTISMVDSYISVAAVHPEAVNRHRARRNFRRMLPPLWPWAPVVVALYCWNPESTLSAVRNILWRHLHHHIICSITKHRRLIIYNIRIHIRQRNSSGRKPRRRRRVHRPRSNSNSNKVLHNLKTPLRTSMSR